MRRFIGIILDAIERFNHDDGWAIASHLAMSTLMALFPFLLVLTSFAANVFGSQNLAEEAARLLLEVWPTEVATPIAADIHDVLSRATGNVLSIGLVLSIFFASSGIESLRVGLNRAYKMRESRAWWLLRLESIGYVLLGAIVLLIFALLVPLGPLLWNRLARVIPELSRFGSIIVFARLATASVVIVTALVVMHLWLPAGRRRLGEVLPGIVTTLLLWLIAGEMFGRYLAEFAFTYAAYYASLASAMIALVFLYLTGLIFIFGGELNTAIALDHEKRIQETREPS